MKDEDRDDSLAIGSKFAVDTYGLSIVDEGIQDIKNNQTLFVHISRSIDNKNTLPFTFFVIDPKVDNVGTLHGVLSVFKEHNINLLKIESRPSTKKLGKYIFYIKADISPDDKKRVLILKELRKIGKVTLITK